MRRYGSGANLTVRDLDNHASDRFRSLHRRADRAPSCRPWRRRRRARPSPTRPSRSRVRPRRTTQASSRSAPRSPPPPRRRIYAELAPLVLAQGFFWDRDFGQRFDPRKPAVDNLAAAIALEQGNGIGWDALAAFAAEPAVEPLDSRPGVDLRAGAPGLRQRRVLQAARRHLYERHRLGLSARRRNAGARRAAARTRPRSARSGCISSACSASRAPTANRRPAATNGRASPCRTASTGFVAPGSLMSLTAERLCYIKDLVGGWRIAGYIAGGN